MNDLFWPVGKAFLIAFVLTPIIRDIFRAYNVVDRPGRRKVHVYPIPRVGGIPIAVAYAFTLLSFASFDETGYGPIWLILPGAAVTFAVGLIDDFVNMRPLVKLLGQISGAILVYLNGLRVETIGAFPIPDWLSFGITVFWLLLTSNALNLIDGLDGLCTGMGFVATLTFLVVGLIQGNQALVAATIPLAGALLGFLCFNFNPATVFLGDSGALLIGFLLGCYGLLWTGPTVTVSGVLVALLALAIPILDVSLSILRRFLKKQGIFSADRGHIHHRLLDRGLTVRRAVLVLYMMACVGIVFAVLFAHPFLGRFYPLWLVLLGAVVWACIHQLRYAEFDVFRRLLFQGELRRTIAAKSRIEYLSAALEKCSNEDQWWKLLVDFASASDCARIQWLGGEAVREQVFSEGAGAWTFSVPIGLDESICFHGRDGSDSAVIDFAGVGRVIRKSRPVKRLEQEQPTLP